jgi:hypothetical protein
MSRLERLCRRALGSMTAEVCACTGGNHTPAPAPYTHYGRHFGLQTGQKAIIEAARTKQTGVSLQTLLQFGRQVRDENWDRNGFSFLRSYFADTHTDRIELATIPFIFAGPR